jgi:hypothetical protein
VLVPREGKSELVLLQSHEVFPNRKSKAYVWLMISVDAMCILGDLPPGVLMALHDWSVKISSTFGSGCGQRRGLTEPDRN